MSDLFDLFDLSDIPDSIGDVRRDQLSNEIIELFQIAGRELNIDEITVAHYRKYVKNNPARTIKNKTQIMNKVYKMSKERNTIIESVDGKKGVYRLKTHEHDNNG